MRDLLKLVAGVVVMEGAFRLFRIGRRCVHLGWRMSTTGERLRLWCLGWLATAPCLTDAQRLELETARALAGRSAAICRSHRDVWKGKR